MAVTTTMAVERPTPSFSLVRINTAMAEPPTTEGVTLLANSHSIITSNDLRQLSA